MTRLLALVGVVCVATITYGLYSEFASARRKLRK